MDLNLARKATDGQRMDAAAPRGSIDDDLVTPSHSGGRRRHVLCVDDDADLLLGLGLVLRRRFVVTTATSGVEALTLLTARQPVDPPVDIVLSDLRMPGMSGAELLAAVSRRRPELPRLLLTGQADAREAAADLDAARVFRLLVKPCPTEVLVAAIVEAIGHAR